MIINSSTVLNFDHSDGWYDAAYSGVKNDAQDTLKDIVQHRSGLYVITDVEVDGVACQQGIFAPPDAVDIGYQVKLAFHHVDVYPAVLDGVRGLFYEVE